MHVPANKQLFLDRHSAAIARLKAEDDGFFYQYTEGGSVKRALEVLRASYHVYRTLQVVDDDFYNTVKAANAYLDDIDEATVRDMAHGRIDPDKTRLLALQTLLNNRRYNQEGAAQVGRLPEIVRRPVPRPNPAAKKKRTIDDAIQESAAKKEVIRPPS